MLCLLSRFFKRSGVPLSQTVRRILMPRPVNELGLQIGGNPYWVFEILRLSRRPLSPKERGKKVMEEGIPPVTGKEGEDRVKLEVRYYRAKRLRGGQPHPLLSRLFKTSDGKWGLTGYHK